MIASACGVRVSVEGQDALQRQEPHTDVFATSFSVNSSLISYSPSISNRIPPRIRSNHRPHLETRTVCYPFGNGKTFPLSVSKNGACGLSRVIASCARSPMDTSQSMVPRTDAGALSQGVEAAWSRCQGFPAMARPRTPTCQYDKVS